MKFKEMTECEKEMTLRFVIGYSDRYELSREEASEIIRYFVSWVNKQRIENELSVVIMEKDKKQHKLDIQEVKDSIFITRDSQQEALSLDEVQAIRDLLADGYSKSAIAKAFGYSRNTVSKYA